MKPRKIEPKILAYIARNGVTSQPTLAEKLPHDRSNVYRNIGLLKKEGLIEVVTHQDGIAEIFQHRNARWRSDREVKRNRKYVWLTWKGLQKVILDGADLSKLREFSALYEPTQTAFIGYLIEQMEGWKLSNRLSESKLEMFYHAWKQLEP